MENRFLLTASTAPQWVMPQRITYSFVPDGTMIGGVASNLQNTLNARFATADWQAQFAKAAAAWERLANINFSQVPDNGAPIGVSGNQQNDHRFGDIRIGGYFMAGNTLGFAYQPPPINGGTNAGDIFLNTRQLWQINGTTYNLLTVALHEFGHALGLSHASTSTAAMWPTYTGTKTGPTAADAASIRAIYGARANDVFDTVRSNNSASRATDITPYLDAKGTLTLPALDITPPTTIGSPDVDWYKITVPSSTTGTMMVRMQSANLSLLSPDLAVFDATGKVILSEQESVVMGATVNVTLKDVKPSQVYLIRCKGASTSDSGYGAYGLQVNFGRSSQAPISVPNTTRASQIDRGGGLMTETTRGFNGVKGERTTRAIAIGKVEGPADTFTIGGNNQKLNPHVHNSIVHRAFVPSPLRGLHRSTPRSGNTKTVGGRETLLNSDSGPGNGNAAGLAVLKATRRGNGPARYQAVDQVLEVWKSEKRA